MTDSGQTGLGATTSPSVVEGAVGARRSAVAAAAQTWAKQLIDLGGRNSLLYYRDLKAGTLDLDKADPAALAGLLQGRPTRLSKLFAPDEVPEQARRAKAVLKKARENFEERGLSTLYIARGMATWQPETGESVPQAPVLLAQLSLVPVGVMETDFSLGLADAWEPNPTLLHLLATTFGVAISPDEVLDSSDPGANLDEALEALAAKVAEVPGYSQTLRTVVGNFTYSKQPMVADLEGALDVMVESDIIAALAGDGAAIGKLRSSSPGADMGEPDRVLPANEFLAIDADASQNFVINAALAGSNLVVQGPPGTGKSQTIANLIATLSAHGKSVLFVAEKRAAIDAVVGRLSRVGLGDLVLDLHGGGSSRTKMIEELRRSYEASSSIPRVDRSSEDARLVDRRIRLNRHVEALHARREPWALSAYELQARLLAVPEHLSTLLRIHPDHLTQLDPASLDAAADALSDWVTLGGPSIERGVSPWARAAELISSPTEAEAALVLSREVADALPALQAGLQELSATCGLRGSSSLAGWKELLDLLRDVSAVSEVATPAIWDLDLDALLGSLKPLSGSALGRTAASVFSSEYRQARNRVRSVLRDATFDDRLYDMLVRARSVHERWSLNKTKDGSPNAPANLVEILKHFEEVNSAVSSLRSSTGSAGVADAELTDVIRFARDLVGDERTLFRLPRVRDLAHALDSAGLGSVRSLVAEQDLSASEARKTLEYVFCASVLDRVRLIDPDLGGFDASTHDKLVAEFVDADQQQIATGASRVRRAVAEHLYDVRNRNQEGDAVMAAELRKKRHLKTLRELTGIAPDILLALRPCWAMSPLSVSQLLYAQQLFDVVVFDEASQVPPADAIPALMRARQVIVAGDSKQLPPTTFFASGTDDDGGEGDGEGEGDRSGIGNLSTGMESVLDAVSNVVTAGSTTLRWHYRSRDERLIAFSNAQQSLYNWQMVTFPGARSQEPIRHEYVPWRPSPGGGGDSSADEVRRVVELIAEHAHTRPNLSLGVIAMGIRHAERIESALREERVNDPVLDEFCRSRQDEPLFVKNLERVQGDERDAIILTIGYGKSSDGRLLYRFGPINQSGGERRLNVAVTRSRSRITLVSTFKSADLDPAKLTGEGTRMLGRYVAYAESGGTDLGHVRQDHPPLNAFEVDILERLTKAGIPLIPQVGVSGYYIDFAAQHPERRGEFVLAIEADGASYHSSPTARERDRLRQGHLENLGWRFHRIWSSEWFANREAEIEKVVAAWRAAVLLADRGLAVGASPVIDSLIPSIDPSGDSFDPPSAVPERSRRHPWLSPGTPIDQYSPGQLWEIVAWIASDGLLRTDAELLDAAIDEMGYQRRGTRIVAALKEAIGLLRSRGEPPTAG